MSEKVNSFTSLQDKSGEDFIVSMPLPDSGFWKEAQKAKGLISFELELTARCNNNCRHCYINLPAEDAEAKAKELSFQELARIIDQAQAMHALWCLLTGGEPLLRDDFCGIYLYLRKKGFLVSLFTNAALIRQEHIRLFKRFPPRDIEVTVYGTCKETYEQVTRTPGSFEAFSRGLDLLAKNKIKVRLKAVMMRSNTHEFAQIAAFCRHHTRDYFRFDPFLHLRYDRDKKRNEEIISERLSSAEIIAMEFGDKERRQAIEKECAMVPGVGGRKYLQGQIFSCGAGCGKFCLSYDGFFKLCSSLEHPGCMSDLRRGTLQQAFAHLVPRVRNLFSRTPEFLSNCYRCPKFNVCMWCPANAFLERGVLDSYVEYFCQIAHARHNQYEQLKRRLDLSVR
jgi:MoaA/NifB/PqqE/SkfB family radical SAM enzyme